MKKFGLILVSLLLSTMAIFADNEKITRDKSVLPSVCRNFLSDQFRTDRYLAYKNRKQSVRNKRI